MRINILCGPESFDFNVRSPGKGSVSVLISKLGDTDRSQEKNTHLTLDKQARQELFLVRAEPPTQQHHSTSSATSLNASFNAQYAHEAGWVPGQKDLNPMPNRPRAWKPKKRVVETPLSYTWPHRMRLSGYSLSAASPVYSKLPHRSPCRPDQQPPFRAALASLRIRS